MNKYVKSACEKRIAQISAIIENLNNEKKELESFIKEKEKLKPSIDKEKGVMLNPVENACYNFMLSFSSTRDFLYMRMLHKKTFEKVLFTLDKCDEVFSRFLSLGLILKCGTYNGKGEPYFTLNKEHPNYKARYNKSNGES